MSKEEIALELTKVISEKVLSGLSYSENAGRADKAIVEAYNYIYENITSSER